MGLYTHTTRAEGIVLTGAGSTSDIFNVDHQNHVVHTAAPFLNSWEATVAQMNLETDPGPNGIPSLPASLSDEIERLRYVLSQIKGFISSGTPATHWYTKTGDFTAFTSFPAAGARIEQHVKQKIPSGVETQVNFDTKLYDTTNVMATPPSIKAPATGVYIVGGTLELGDGVTTGPQEDFRLRLKSGSTTIAAENIFSGAVTGPKAISITTLAKFTANDLLTMTAFQTQGTTVETDPEFGPMRPALWMALIARL